jgi:hypothetical protein
VVSTIRARTRIGATVRRVVMNRWMSGWICGGGRWNCRIACSEEASWDRSAWTRRLKKRATGSGWPVVASMLLCNYVATVDEELTSQRLTSRHRYCVSAMLFQFPRFLSPSVALVKVTARNVAFLNADQALAMSGLTRQNGSALQTPK